MAVPLRFYIMRCSFFSVVEILSINHVIMNQKESALMEKKKIFKIIGYLIYAALILGVGVYEDVQGYD